MKSVPLFKSNYSIGKSILTLSAPNKPDHKGPVSIFDIAVKNNLKTISIVDDSFGGSMEAFENATKLGIKLIFGVRVYVTNCLNKEAPEFGKQRSKIVLMPKSKKGYDKLVRFWSHAATANNINGEPHATYEALSELQKEGDIQVLVPFYDSFIFQNVFYNGLIVPSFFKQPVFCVEDKGLLFDEFLKEHVENYASANGAQVLNVSSIFYEKDADFLAYLTFRCIHERTMLDKPELLGMTSPAFSFESWKKANT